MVTLGAVVVVELVVGKTVECASSAVDFSTNDARKFPHPRIEERKGEGREEAGTLLLRCSTCWEEGRMPSTSWGNGLKVLDEPGRLTGCCWW